MKPRRYRVNNGILKFTDGITTFEDYLTVPEGVVSIDFNDIEHFTKPLRLTDTRITEIDFKNVITVDNVYLPAGIKIKENLYWANKFILENNDYELLESPRLKYLNVYNDKELIYLGGSVIGKLEERDEQRQKMLDAGFAVYSPVNHMTHGDPVATKQPSLVADIDIYALEKADIIFFDLRKLTAGTCAEVGYSVAKKWYKEKRIYYVYNDTKNFFINGLLRHFQRVNSIEEFLRMEKLI